MSFEDVDYCVAMRRCVLLVTELLAIKINIGSMRWIRSA